MVKIYVIFLLTSTLIETIKRSFIYNNNKVILITSYYKEKMGILYFQNNLKIKRWNISCIVIVSLTTWCPNYMNQR